MGILMGDCRRNGKYYSMILDCAKPGEVESIVIKEQCNEKSKGKAYANQNFIPISQEYFLILKKALPYMLDFSYTKHTKLDIRTAPTLHGKTLLPLYLNTITKKNFLWKSFTMQSMDMKRQ